MNMLKIFIYYFFLTSLFSCNKKDEMPKDMTVQSASRRTQKNIFSDEFNQVSHTPDTSKWSLCPQASPAWAKYLSESYDQAFVENGNLVLLAEKKDGQYKVGGVQTRGKFSFQYGRVDVSARFTKTAKGGWPAIWMMPEAPKYEGGWPACGEIDIMEQLNHDAVVHHTIHSHYKNTLNLYIPVPSMISFYKKNEYNIYSVEWTPDSLIFFVNGVQKLKYSINTCVTKPTRSNGLLTPLFILS